MIFEFFVCSVGMARAFLTSFSELWVCYYECWDVGTWVDIYFIWNPKLMCGNKRYGISSARAYFGAVLGVDVADLFNNAELDVNGNRRSSFGLCVLLSSFRLSGCCFSAGLVPFLLAVLA
ncbi:hypothetical protein Dimus_020487 [Dionaea muscipula]